MHHSWAAAWPASSTLWLPAPYHGVGTGCHFWSVYGTKQSTRYPPVQAVSETVGIHWPGKLQWCFLWWFHLGIPELLVQVPLMRWARVNKLFDQCEENCDPVLAGVVRMSGLSKVSTIKWLSLTPGPAFCDWSRQKQLLRKTGFLKTSKVQNFRFLVFFYILCSAIQIIFNFIFESWFMCLFI